MNRIALIIPVFFLVILNAMGQDKLSAAYKSFQADPQMKYGIGSLLVVDANSGKTIFSSNEQVGLAPASTLKVITASTSLEIFGPAFQFATPFVYNGNISDGVLKSDIIVKASGDPTLGSWRYTATKDFQQLKDLSIAFQEVGIKEWNGKFVVDNGSFGTQNTPGGWTFDDMGNYYGAGPSGFNWYENQYDLVMNPGASEGQKVTIVGTRPVRNIIGLTNELTTGPKGSGDQAIIFPDRWPGGTVRGTVPAGVKEFVISGSISDPVDYWMKTLREFGAKKSDLLMQNANVVTATNPVGKDAAIELMTMRSPGLDSIVYFFLQKSVNLYGEALVKKLALQAGKEATTANGIKWMRDFWKTKGVESGALRIVDGSGLSPHNRVTTRTLVQVMQYAKKQPWYPAFYEGLPSINGLKMKSGSISGVRGYTGYVKSSSGGEYVFAFLVNNFDGPSSAIMQKMFTVLNTLK